MKQFIFAIVALLTLGCSAFATDVVISSSTLSGSVFPTAGAARSVSISCTNSSTTCTASATWPASLVGLSGYYASINSSDYQISATTSTSSITLSSAFTGSTGSYTATIYPLITLRVFADRAFTPNGAGYVVQPGSPSNPNGFWKQVGCSIISGSLYIPTLTLPSMLDSANAQDRTARYSAYFFSASGALLQPYAGFTSFQVPASPTTTTWPLLATYNAPASTYQLDMYTYSRDQIAALIAAANLSIATQNISATSGGTTTINFASGAIAVVSMPAGNTTITAINVPIGFAEIAIIQDSAGGRTVTWNSLFKWSGGTAPTLGTGGANSRDVFFFYCNGTNCYLTGSSLNAS